MKVTILMPSLNEAKSIEGQIKLLPRKELEEKGFSVQALLVDGGSCDGTPEIARNAGIDVITTPKGYGVQYIEGFAKAEGDIIATCDSDMSYPVELIPEFIETLISENLDFISINRFARLGPGAMRPLNYTGNLILSLVLRILYGLPIIDSQSGMWILRKEIIPRLNLKETGMPFSQELKIEAFRKVRAKEVNGAYYKRIGETKLKAFRDGTLLLLHLMRKRLQG